MQAMSFAGGVDADVGYADDYVENYDYEPGSNRFGVSANLGGSVGAEFDVSHLPPPPNEPPPPLPEGRPALASPEDDPEAGGERRKKKKKHRDGERGEGDEENGERRHRKKKKKHREGERGEGEDGERPRRHRRHRREAPEEGEAAPSAHEAPDGGYPSVEAHPAYGLEAEPQFVPEQPGGYEYDPGADLSASAEVPQFGAELSTEPGQFGVGLSGSVEAPQYGVDLDRHSPHSDTRVLADPVAGEPVQPAVEDYYYRASPRTAGYRPELEPVAPPEFEPVAPPDVEPISPPEQFAPHEYREWPPAAVHVDSPHLQLEAEPPVPEPEPLEMPGDVPLSADVAHMAEAPPPDADLHYNGRPDYDPRLEFDHGGDPSMPPEPSDGQNMYVFNPDLQGPPPDGYMEGPPPDGYMQGPPPPEMGGPPQPAPPKQKGGFSKLFSFGKGKRKGKQPPSEMQVSAPIGVPTDQRHSYGPSPIVGGTPDSTLRSGVVQQDPWQSNPDLFNPNMDTLDPQMGRQGTLDQHPQPGARGGQRGKKLPSTRPIPQNTARVILLDGEEIEFRVDKKATGREVFERVCDHLSIEERDYFGLTFGSRKWGVWFWLDTEKKVSKQVKNEPWFFNFQVKFYPPEPSLIQEDITRYQLTLQVRQDIYTGKLPCSWVTQALLGSFLVQSELGDFDPDDHVGIDYLREFEFVHGQNDQLLTKIAGLHKNHKGMTPDQADLKYLETAKRLEQYGFDLHPARDMDDVPIFIGVYFSGAVVYRGSLRISRFAWPKVLRISYRKNFFYLKIRSECYDDFEAIVGFKLENNKLAKRLWKIAVEHHTFFRLKEPRFAPKTNVIPRFGSRYRYSGRTFFQYRTMSIERPHPNFDRSLMKRRTASMPMLAGGGSQYGSMHSLNRPHPRSLTMNKVQSVEYLGPTGSRTPTMGPRAGSVEFGAPSSVGGSLQNLPVSSGQRVVVGTGGPPRPMPPGRPEPMRGSADMGPRGQFQGRMSTGSADQGRGYVAQPGMQVHVRGGSVGSAEEDLL